MLRHEFLLILDRMRYMATDTSLPIHFATELRTSWHTPEKYIEHRSEHCYKGTVQDVRSTAVDIPVKQVKREYSVDSAVAFLQRYCKSKFTRNHRTKKQ